MNKKLLWVSLTIILCVCSKIHAANEFSVFGHTLEAVLASEKHTVTITPQNTQNVEFIVLSPKGLSYIKNRGRNKHAPSESEKCECNEAVQKMQVTVSRPYSDKDVPCTISLPNPHSIISTITLTPAIDGAFLNGYFPGVVDHEPQSLAFYGFLKIAIKFNPTAIEALINKK